MLVPGRPPPARSTGEAGGGGSECVRSGEARWESGGRLARGFRTVLLPSERYSSYKCFLCEGGSAVVLIRNSQ